jgi:hypothetical protein
MKANADTETSITLMHNFNRDYSAEAFFIWAGLKHFWAQSRALGLLGLFSPWALRQHHARVLDFVP